jgi:hypothetical protein
MSPEIITAIVAGITSIVGAFVWGIRLLFNKLATYLDELKPNSGSSMKDQVTRLETAYERLDNKVDKLYELLIEYSRKGK